MRAPVVATIVRRTLIAGAITLAAALAAALAGALALAAAADAGLARGLLVRVIQARVHRPLEVAGSLDAHLLSRAPRITATGVTIGNPPWVPPGTAATIGEISIIARWPGIHQPLGVTSVTVRSATLHLMRDAAGHANWQWTNPDEHAPNKDMAIVRFASIDNAHVILDDQRRHLAFDGRVSAQDGPGGDAPLRIRGEGQLNGRAATFEIKGDALGGASHEKPYHFALTERSGASQVAATGQLPHPFDLDLIDVTFEASGPDLKDLYQLVGVSLFNTGAYRLSGELQRRADLSRFTDLKVVSGQSDARGTLTIDSSGERPRLDLDLDSQSLRAADLGERAAGRAGGPPPPWLLSDAAVSPEALRHADARFRYRAARVQVARLSLENVAAQGTVEHGVLNVAPLTGIVMQGKLEAHLTLDARQDPPAAHADVQLRDVQLADFPRRSSQAAPIEGSMSARIQLTGRGRSLHQVAASGSGSVVAVVPQGTVRDSLAEASGVDLRGLGLMLAKDQRETALRCAVARFTATDGTFTAEQLIADTEPVLISGAGRIDMKSEALDLLLRGHPKHVRLLRLRAPVHITGTLLHPSFSVEPRHLQIIDPGTAQDENCSALLAAARLSSR